MLGKAIQQTASQLATIERGAAAVLPGAAVAGAALSNQERNNERVGRGQAFVEGGLLGVLTNEFRPDQVHRNQESRARDGRGRFAPIRAPNGRPPNGPPNGQPPSAIRPGQPEENKVEEEIKEPEEDKIDNPRIDEQTPLLQDSRGTSGQPSVQVQPDDVVVHVENALGGGGRRDVLTNNKFISMVGAFIVGQILDPTTISTIIKKIYEWWVISDEHTSLTDPGLDGITLEERIQKPLPPQCKRLVYRDAQTGELRSIVQCGEQGQRVYYNR